MCINKGKWKIDLGFVGEEFYEGTHMCLIYKDEEERKAVITKYLAAGLSVGEKVAYFATSPSTVTFKALLQSCMKPTILDDLELLDAQATYCPGEVFQPDTMLTKLKQYYTQAIDEDYCACRVSGEMQWALDDLRDTSRLMEYEARVNQVVKTHPVTAICQYDARRFSPDTLIDCLKVHPFMIVNGQVIENPYYMSPQQFLQTQHDAK